MECPVDKKQHFRHILLFAFHRQQEAAEAARDICDVYGEDSMTESTAQRWFAKFKNGNYEVKVTPRSGRSSELNENRLKALLKKAGDQSQRKLTKNVGSAQRTTSNQGKQGSTVENIQQRKPGGPSTRPRQAAQRARRQNRPPGARMGGYSASRSRSRLPSNPLTVQPNEEDLQNWLLNFFESRPADLSQRGIDRLVERWQEIVNNNGENTSD